MSLIWIFAGAGVLAFVGYCARLWVGTPPGQPSIEELEDAIYL